MDNENLTISFCKAWNNLDASYLDFCFTHDFVYSSQMVLKDLNGKDEYLKYIKAKFNAIKNGANTVTAELGYYENEPCFILTQTLAIPIRAPFGNPKYESPNHPLVNEINSTVLLKFENGFIKSAIMCTIPGVSYIKRTGVYPK